MAFKISILCTDLHRTIKREDKVCINIVQIPHNYYNSRMTPDISALRTYFAKLGLTDEIADIYFALHQHGPQTMSALTRTSGVERTRIYRLIDQLMESGLVDVDTRSKRGMLKAAPIANLRILISKREQELQSLHDELGLIEQVLGRNQLTSPVMRVQMYEGFDGVSQMIWNETSAKTEVLSITYQDIRPVLTKEYSQWVQECNQRGVTFKELTTDAGAKNDKLSHLTAGTKILSQWESKIMPAHASSINHNVVTYNDVTAHYVWKDGEVFGTEIYNKSVADSCRHYFEHIWSEER